MIDEPMAAEVGWVENSLAVDTELFRRLFTGVFFRIGQRFKFKSNVISMFLLRITVKTRSSSNIFISAVSHF